MLVSPFTFYRGAALVMAADLATTPRSGLAVQACGDAHLSNFGVFASPERRLIFDVNDFDETLPGPWEWDVKRLAASLEVAGRGQRLLQKATRARSSARRSPATARRCAASPRCRTSRSGTHGWTSSGCSTRSWRARPQADKARSELDVAKARTHDSLQAFAKLTHLVDGEPRIISDPPLIVPIDELRAPSRAADVTASVRRALARLPPHAAERPPRAARAVPVRGPRPQGRRRRQRRHPRWIVLLLGRDEQRSAVPAGQGGPGLGARGVHRQERLRESRRAGRGRPAPDAGRQRHLPRLAPLDG